MGLASLPLTYLNNPAMFFCSLLHDIYFSDRITDRLLNINMFTCFKGVNKNLAMPVIGSSYNDSIYILILQHLPVIDIELWFRLVQLKKIICAVCQYISVNIAHCDTLHFLIL